MKNWKKIYKKNKKLIINNEDLILFNEAFYALKAGALRGAYLLIWLACIESIKRKFKEISYRDSEVKRIYSKIKNKENEHKATDKYILDQAKELEIITQTEFLKLENIYKLRCIYAHPYEEAPNNESVVAAITNIVQIVLSTPAKLRYGYLEQQVKLLVHEKSLLDDVPRKIENYAEIVYKKASNDLHLWFLKKLWKEMSNVSSDPSLSKLFERCIIFSRHYLDLAIDNFYKNWDIHSDILKFKNILPEILVDIKLFKKINQRVQDTIVSVLIEFGSDGTRHLLLLDNLSQNNALTNRQKNKYDNTIRNIKPHILAKLRLPFKIYARQIINYLKSNNWYFQNPAILVIKNIGQQEIESLDTKVQFELGNNVLQAAEGEAYEAQAFIYNISINKDLKWPKYFYSGILTECFINDRNEIRIKDKLIKETVIGLRNLQVKQRKEITDMLVKRIKNGHLRSDSYILESNILEVIKKLTKVAKDNKEVTEIINKIIKALKDYLPRDEKSIRRKRYSNT